MNVQQLRNSILQEAIEGRLVPQDPNDEPASVLLDKIRKEKARLVKEGKLKKKDLEEIPISEDEKPFEIPKSWEWVRLSSLFNFIDYRGNTPQKITSGIPLVTAKNVKKGYNDYSIRDYISVEEYELRKSRGISKKGDILFTTEAPLGNVSIADLDIFSAGQRLITLQSFSTNFVNNVLIMFFMLSDSFQKSLLEKKTGTTVAGIKASKLKYVLLPLPPLAEQKRIVTKIEELLPKVEEYGKAQDALNKLNEELPEKLKKSVLQEAITGRLVPQDPNDEPASVLLNHIREEKKQLVKEGKLKKKDLVETPISEDEKPFEIPESWEWSRLGDIFEHSSGKQLRASDTEGTLREYITTSNLYWERFELNKLKSMYYKDSEIEKCTAKKGDLLVCEGGDIGRSAIWSYDYDICLQNHVHRLRPYDNRYTLFVFYILWFYKSVGLIGGKGIGIQGLSASALKSIIIPLPPLAEQKRIVAKIEEVFAEIDKLK